jgi:hypothetical protein
MRHLLVILLLLLSVKSFSQLPEILTGTVRGDDTPLFLVNIYSDVENNGTYSDEKGNFIINIDTNATMIIFSYISYHNDTIFLTDTILKKSIIIKLRKNSYFLEEVVVSGNNNYKEQGYYKKLGGIDKKENNTFGVNKGNIIAYYFHNKQEAIGTLDYVRFRFSKIKNNPKIRINIYEPMFKGNGEISPGNMIFQSELITLKNRDKIFRYDFLDNVFIYKKGIFVAIELVDGGKYTSNDYNLNYPRFMLTDEVSERLTFKSFMGADWYRFSINSRENQNPYNIKIELKVNY